MWDVNPYQPAFAFKSYNYKRRKNFHNPWDQLKLAAPSIHLPRYSLPLAPWHSFQLQPWPATTLLLPIIKMNIAMLYWILRENVWRWFASIYMNSLLKIEGFLHMIGQTKNGKTLKVALFKKNASPGFCPRYPTPHKPKTSHLHSLILLNSPGRADQKRHAALGILVTSSFLPRQVTSSYCCKHWEVQTTLLFCSSMLLPTKFVPGNS